MNRLQTIGEAGAQVWGLLFIGLLLVGITAGVLDTILVACRRIRQRRARVRFTREALEEAGRRAREQRAQRAQADQLSASRLNDAVAQWHKEHSQERPLFVPDQWTDQGSEQ